MKHEMQTWVKSPALNPPLADGPENSTAEDGLGANFNAQLGTSACLEERVIPLTREYVHQVHATCIRDFYGGDVPQEK
jgi:hypothetical protein